jgi:hypothetical protein
MRRSLLIFTSFLLFLTGIAIPTAVATYEVGSTGPAGGKIFITPSTAGNNTGKYFEVALEDVTNSRYTFCNNTKQLISETQNSGIGFGESNTAAMIAWGCITGAAVAADGYSLGGLSDWFLPSKDEAAVLYATQAATGVFDGADTHWTSTGFDANKSWTRYFSSDTVFTLDQTADGGFFVRAVRSFFLTAPNAPTIGAATALSATSASISFTAPTNNGGATIETYTATSTPGSFTGQLLQAGSGSITVTGLTSSTSYTFTVTASNSAGTSTASSASVSITMPASDEELAEQAAQATAARDAAARAASEAAAARREAEKKSARSEISTKFKNFEKVAAETFRQAEIAGITNDNIEAAIAEIFTLPAESRSDILQVMKVAYKFEVVGKLASSQVSTVYSNELIAVGLISAESKHKEALRAAVKNLPASLRSSYAQIEVALDAVMETIQARKDRLADVMARNAARNVA